MQSCGRSKIACRSVASFMVLCIIPCLSVYCWLREEKKLIKINDRKEVGTNLWWIPEKACSNPFHKYSCSVQRKARRKILLYIRPSCCGKCLHGWGVPRCPNYIKVGVLFQENYFTYLNFQVTGQTIASSALACLWNGLQRAVRVGQRMSA